MFNRDEIKKQLFEELRDKHYLWSFDTSKMGENSLPDELLIEKVLLHLDLPSINNLFLIYPRSYIKEIWKDRLCPLEPRYHSSNVLFGILYFDIKNPHRYIKAQANRMIRINTHQYERSSVKHRNRS